MNLNEHNITFSAKKHFLIKGGDLSIIGTGTISEKEPYFAPIILKGSTENTSNYSVVTVGKDVTLIGWSGIFFDQATDSGAPSNYGMVANLHGTIEYKRDTSNGIGNGIYVNGTVGSEEPFDKNNNYPVINVYSSANISGEGYGIYAAGYARWAIDGANIEGTACAIEIRAGELTIKGGSFKSTATEFSCNPNGNGSTTTGAAIAIVQHTTKRDITVNISGGTFEGLRALNESNPQDNNPAPQVNLSVTGGTFRSMIAIMDKDKSNVSVECAFIVESEGEKRWYFNDSEIVSAVNWINEITSSNVTLKIFENINITEAGAAKNAALWFTKGVTINGNNNVITYNAATGDGLNVLGFSKNVTATVNDLIIDGNEKAFHGINIWEATKISLNNITVKNVNATGINTNCAETTIKDCDVSQNCVWGGVNVDIGSSAGAIACKLIVIGNFKGKIWTETFGNPSDVVYNNAIVTATYNDGAKNWKFWYSPGYDFTSDMKGLLSGAKVILNDNYVLSEGKSITINSGVELKILGGKAFTGTILGPNDNKLVANGMKAGEGGITITGGSLIINGKIMDASGSEAGATVSVTGDGIKISGSLESNATMVIEEGTVVTVENGKTFLSNGTVNNNGIIDNKGTITNDGVLTNDGTIKMIGASEITSTDKKKVVNNGVIADERDKNASAVPVEGEGIVVAKNNADKYKGEGVNVIVQDPEEAKKKEGDVFVDENKFVFIDAITTTGKLNIVMNDGYKQYTVTIPEGTTIAAGTVISVSFIEYQSDSVTRYQINTPGIENFSMKLPCQIGFKKAKVYCDDSELGVSKVRYDAGTGYVTFDASHNSVFTIVLSNASPAGTTTVSSGDTANDYALVIAFVVLVASLGFLAYVIKRR